MKQKRSAVSLLVASSFLVLSVTGVLAFALPFSIRIVGLHALMGFVFVGLIGFHIANNLGHLSRYSRSALVWITAAATIALTLLFLWQPRPVKSILGWSRNMGPSLDRLDVQSDGLVYQYHPAPDYRMDLTIRAGRAFDFENPPTVAIWLENASFYHIKTLQEPENTKNASADLPYWDFKRRGWEEAKRKAEEEKSGREKQLQENELDAVSGATRNSSFDPADYILPADPDNPMPYRLLVELDHPDDDLPSLVYAAEIDNADPRFFQLLELVGYPKQDEDREGKESWSLYYVDYSDAKFQSSLELIDSILLTIDRQGKEGS
ncbi:MAG: hypothetical protein MI807_06455 [Verrucomicrobiales bacterium]|nr:hypothetical protein [Verrucomicrobiales bacterium]